MIRIGKIEFKTQIFWKSSPLCITSLLLLCNRALKTSSTSCRWNMLNLTSWKMSLKLEVFNSLCLYCHYRMICYDYSAHMPSQTFIIKIKLPPLHDFLFRQWVLSYCIHTTSNKKTLKRKRRHSKLKNARPARHTFQP